MEENCRKKYLKSCIEKKLRHHGIFHTVHKNYSLYETKKITLCIRQKKLLSVLKQKKCSSVLNKNNKKVLTPLIKKSKTFLAPLF